MKTCLLCEQEKRNSAFAPDRLSCRKCLSRWIPTPYANHLGYARYQGRRPMIDGRRLDADESESIALVSIAQALKTFDPTQGTLRSWTRLYIHNDIANERRLHERRMVSWTDLGMKTVVDSYEAAANAADGYRDHGAFVEVGPEAVTVECGTAHKRKTKRLLHVHAGLPIFAGVYAYNSRLINEVNAWLETVEAQEIIQKFLAVSVSESGPRNNERRERRFLDAFTLPLLGDLFDGCRITGKIKQRQAKRKFLRLVSEGELILPSEPCADRRCHCGYCVHDPADREAMLAERYSYEDPVRRKNLLGLAVPRPTEGARPRRDFLLFFWQWLSTTRIPVSVVPATHEEVNQCLELLPAKGSIEPSSLSSVRFVTPARKPLTTRTRFARSCSGSDS